MDLDAKVASVQKSRNSFDYWIKLATLDKGHPILLPLKSYDYFENKKGPLKKLVQVIIKSGQIEYGLIKDVEFKTKPFIEGMVIGIDTGLVVPLSTSSGHQYGLGLYGRLKAIDLQIVNLTKMRMKNGYYRKSARLDSLYNKARSLIKNEIGRISNRFLENEKPEEVVLENNKNITQELKSFSGRMRRIIKNTGLTGLRDRLIEKSKQIGTKSFLINQAYTSQECPVCHEIDKRNRKSQKDFKCIKCGYSRNADYVGAVNIRNRRSIPSINIYTPFRRVRGLLEDYYSSKGNPSGGVPVVVPGLTACT
jgi:putative transposase